MNVIVEPLKIDGNKKWSHLVGDEHDLRRMAERLKVSIKQDARGLHLDLNEHQRELAIRYGAKQS